MGLDFKDYIDQLHGIAFPKKRGGGNAALDSMEREDLSMDSADLGGFESAVSDMESLGEDTGLLMDEVTNPRSNQAFQSPVFQEQMGPLGPGMFQPDTTIQDQLVSEQFNNRDLMESMPDTVEQSMERFYRGAIDNSMQYEGGYSDDNIDRGGVTNYGISEKTGLSPDQIRKLSKEDAANMHYNDVIPMVRERWGDNGSAAIGAKMADIQMNMGYKGSVNVMQDALNRLGENISVDGGWSAGGETDKAYKQAIANVGEDEFMAALQEAQLSRYEGIVKNDPSQERFLKGWSARSEYNPLAN